MTKDQLIIFLGGLLALLTATVAAYMLISYFPPSSVSGPRATPSLMFPASIDDQPTVVGWIPYWDQGAAITSFKENVEVFDAIGVFWYALRADGSIAAYRPAAIDDSLITWAHDHGVAVLPIIANLPTEEEEGSWDAERVDLVIQNSADRRQHIADLLALADNHGFDGINIDYEFLREDQREQYTLFIKELSEALHARGKILAIALAPKISEGDPAYSNGSEAQDWQQLAQYADHLYVMTYEEHWENSAPGPIASTRWVGDVLQYARRFIPADKLFAGVPLYGYDWADGDEARGLTYEDVNELLDDYDAQIQWDSQAQSPYFTYEEDEVPHTVWFENSQSVRARMSVFEALGVTNIAFWRLGGEDPSVWPAARAFRD